MDGSNGTRTGLFIVTGVLLLACIGLGWHAAKLSNRLTQLETSVHAQPAVPAAASTSAESEQAALAGAMMPPQTPRLGRVPAHPDSVEAALVALYRWAWVTARGQRRLNALFRDKLDELGQRVTPHVPPIPPWVPIPPDPQRCFPPLPCPPQE